MRPPPRGAPPPGAADGRGRQHDQDAAQERGQPQVLAKQDRAQQHGDDRLEEPVRGGAGRRHLREREVVEVVPGDRAHERQECHGGPLRRAEPEEILPPRRLRRGDRQRDEPHRAADHGAAGQDQRREAPVLHPPLAEHGGDGPREGGGEQGERSQEVVGVEPERRPARLHADQEDPGDAQGERAEPGRAELLLPGPVSDERGRERGQADHQDRRCAGARLLHPPVLQPEVQRVARLAEQREPQQVPAGDPAADQGEAHRHGEAQPREGEAAGGEDQGVERHLAGRPGVQHHARRDERRAPGDDRGPQARVGQRPVGRRRSQRVPSVSASAAARGR